MGVGGVWVVGEADGIPIRAYKDAISAIKMLISLIHGGFMVRGEMSKVSSVGGWVWRSVWGGVLWLGWGRSMEDGERSMISSVGGGRSMWGGGEGVEIQ